MRKLRETKMENKKSFSVLCPSFFSLAVERSENFKSVFARESTSLLREEKTRREIVTLNFATLSPRKLLRRYVSGVVVDDAHFSPEVAPITTVAREEWKEQNGRRVKILASRNVGNPSRNLVSRIMFTSC